MIVISLTNKKTRYQENAFRNKKFDNTGIIIYLGNEKLFRCDKFYKKQIKTWFKENRLIKY